MAKPKPVDLNDDFISGGEKKHQETGEKSGNSKKKKNNEKDKKIRVNFMLHESTKKKLFHRKADTGRTVSSIVEEAINQSL
jgi:hypothetical protein